MIRKLLLCITVLAGICHADIFEKNRSLGKGINMGNMYEAPSEGAWGEMLDTNYFALIAQKGFQTVRIPIRWSTNQRTAVDSPYTVDSLFFKKIDDAINSALGSKLNVIINMHHYDSLFSNPDKESNRFKAIWKQIANRYKDYSDSLLFELLNEPNTRLTAEKWNSLLAETFALVRESNPTRPVILGTAEWGGVGALRKLVLPQDTNIILTIHYYSPFQFTHQGASWVEGSDVWLGTKWQGTYFEKLAIVSDFDYALDYAKKNKVPIFIGEFGAFSTADEESRGRWTAFCARLFEKYDFSWAYWEFCSSFGVYENSKKVWHDTLMNALMSSDTSILTMVAGALGEDILKNGDFSQDTMYWHLQIIDSLSTTKFKTDTAGFTITAGENDTIAWYVQLMQRNIHLKKNHMYVLMFDVCAAAERTITAYAGMSSDPWTAYGANWGVAAFGAKRTVAVPFTMTTDDSVARIAFDFGADTTKTTISNVRLLDLGLTRVIRGASVKRFNGKRMSVLTGGNGITIDFNKRVNGNVSAVIFTLDGRTVYSVKDLTMNNAGLLSLPFTNSTQGRFVLQVKTPERTESLLLN